MNSITKQVVNKKSVDDFVYTDMNFPTYEFLEHNNAPYLNRDVYDIIRATYINRNIPLQTNGEDRIPRAFSHLSWSDYFIIRAMSYE